MVWNLFTVKVLVLVPERQAGICSAGTRVSLGNLGPQMAGTEWRGLWNELPVAILTLEILLERLMLNSVLTGPGASAGALVTCQLFLCWPSSQHCKETSAHSQGPANQAKDDGSWTLEPGEDLPPAPSSVGSD